MFTSTKAYIPSKDFDGLQKSLNYHQVEFDELTDGFGGWNIMIDLRSIKTNSLIFLVGFYISSEEYNELIKRVDVLDSLVFYN